ncbi:TRAFs-binding domain-containing protein [Sinorhizobium meliloti]|uniref:TRAFs-binding domain-containing protein n=1 Tax=Rhizobium meliloti TaxID=382 RepID=UPI0013E31523|nr:TRAFs-binding domain-containing protein [Sinorhizobium meliloti]
MAAASFEENRVESACSNLIECLRAGEQLPDLEIARKVLDALRQHRHMSALKRLADNLVRLGCQDDLVYRQYSQALIESGEPIAAIEMLQGLVRRVTPGAKEWNEAQGLLGRAYKQIYIDACGSKLGMAEGSLEAAIAAYREVFDSDPTQIWHGVNLVALLARAERDGVNIPDFPRRDSLIEGLRHEIERHWSAGTLEAWDYASAAELALAQGDLAGVQRWLKEYLSAADIDAFKIAGTLRQFTEVWGLRADAGEKGAVVAVLRAALLRSRSGALRLTPQQVQRTAEADVASFEKILGNIGVQTYWWVRTAMDRARSVALIRQPDGRGVGTGFLVRGRDLHEPLGDELFLLTNAHVVSDSPEQRGALRSDKASITFEATAGSDRTARRHRVREIAWNSPPELLDTSLLRFVEPPVGIEPCPVSDSLPVIDEDQRVYVIGHPLGGELSFSLQDNRLLDHEGPTTGKPTIAGRVLLHYRAPTEPGSSGSPVFSADWDVIGLHHSGADFMSKLNGKEGTYAANEGIWIRSIKQAIVSRSTRSGCR